MLAGPVPAARASAGAETGPPVTVPTLTNWTPVDGSRYSFARTARLVVAPRDTAARRVATTLAGDLRAADRGTVAVVHGGPRSGDTVVAVEPARQKSLGEEGYELTAGRTLRITGATGAGACYGTRTLLQLLTAGDRIPAGRTVGIPQYAERGVGVCACYIHITPEWLENLVRDMAYSKLNQLLLELKVKSDEHPEANTWGDYTKDEIRRLVALGEKYHGTAAAGRAVDGDPDTAWHAPAPSKGTLTVDLGREHGIDRIRLAEDIRQGRQVESAVVEARTGEGRQTVAAVGTIGASRILVLPAPVTVRQWRLRVLGSRHAAHIAEFGLHRSQVQA
ncbi:glycoside hydrolase family 20 zincin-like fold domain-containing protein [Streptomyces sp. NPDC001970]